MIWDNSAVHFAFTSWIINPSESSSMARGVCPAMETPKPAFYLYGNGPEARGHRGNIEWDLEGPVCLQSLL